MNGHTDFLGIVRDGEYQPLLPDPGRDVRVRFTSIQPQAAVPPETGELQLSDYEGSAIMLRGLDQGDWVYATEVLDQAGPILTAVVQQVFDRGNYRP